MNNRGGTRSSELARAEPFAQFIVKYRAGSTPAGDQFDVPERLQATLDGSGLASPHGSEVPLQLHWLRRMSGEADVFRVSRPLDRQAAAQLLRAFASDPDVEYIEVDGIVTIQP